MERNYKWDREPDENTGFSRFHILWEEGWPYSVDSHFTRVEYKGLEKGKMNYSYHVYAYHLYKSFNSHKASIIKHYNTHITGWKTESPEIKPSKLSLLVSSCVYEIYVPRCYPVAPHKLQKSTVAIKAEVFCL